MSSHLILIEAPGKIATLRAILDTLGVDAQVMATRGRIFDLPKDRIGLDPSTLLPAEWEPVSAYRVRELQEAMQKAGSVLIMTDDDVEGEVIAHHLVNLSGRQDAQRVRLKGLTVESVRQALYATDTLNPHTLSVGVARRSLDRVIGYVLSRPRPEADQGILSGVIGRIQTPLLQMAVRANPVIGWLRHDWPAADGADPWALTVPVRRCGLEEARRMKTVLGRLSTPPPAAVGWEQQVPFEPPLPWDGGEALLHTAHALHAPLREVSRALQRNYESGRMSYPRSDSRRLTPESLRTLNRIAHRHGMATHMDRLAQAAREDTRRRVQDAHEALHPLTEEVPLHLDEMSLSFEDKVLVTLTRHLLEAASPEATLTHQSAEVKRLVDSDTWAELTRLSSALRANLVWTRSVKQVNGSSRRDALDPLFPPPFGEGRRCAHRDGAASAVTFHPRPADQILLGMLLKKGLGRPSTYTHHVENVLRRYFNAALKPNGNAFKAIRFAEAVAPVLLDPNRVAEVERLLEEALGGDLAGASRTKIEQALRMIGLEPNDLRDAVKMIAEADPKPDEAAHKTARGRISLDLV